MCGILLAWLPGSLPATIAALEIKDTIVSMEPSYRKALLEEFTGMHCSNCPAGHAVANEIHAYYPDDCFFINIHAGNLAIPYGGEIDLRSAYGDSLFSMMDVSSIPCASVNRHVFPGNSGYVMMSYAWLQAVEDILSMDAYVNIGATASVDWKSRELTVRVQLYYTEDSPKDTNYLHIALLQSSIVGTQDRGELNPDQTTEDGRYIHKHVLRDLLTGLSGETISTTKKDCFVEKVFKETLPEQFNQTDMPLLDIQLLAFVSESETEIVNVCEAPVFFNNSPEYVFDIDNIQQLPHYTCDQDIRLTFELTNRSLGSESVQSVDFLIENPEGEQQEFSYTVQGDFKPYDSKSVESVPLKLSQTGKDEEIRLRITRVNGKNLNYMQEDWITRADKDYVVLNAPAITLDIWQDRWGEDISWTLRDESGLSLATVDTYPNLKENGTQQHTYNMDLSEGCNVFTIRDRQGDGINSRYGEGHLQISKAEGEVLLQNDGTYTDSLVWLLRYFPAGNESVSMTDAGLDLQLWPNPASASSEVSLAFSLDEPACLQVSILSVNGRQVLDLGSRLYPAGLNVAALPLDGLAPGLYLVLLQGDGATGLARLVVR